MKEIGKLLAIGLFLFFSLSLRAASEQVLIRDKTVKLSGNRKLSVNLYRANPSSEKWIVFLSGTGPFVGLASQELYDPAIRDLVQKGFNLAVVSKPGILPRESSYSMYLDSFLAQQRVLDYGVALRQAFKKHSQLFLIGNSEGAYLAPEVAFKEPKVRGVILKAGGTRPWLEEELAREVPGSEGYDRALEVVQNIRSGNFPPDFSWHGYPATALRSFDQLKAKEALALLKVPVLAMLAADDEFLDIKGTMEDLAEAAKTPGSRLSRVVFFQGGHGIEGAAASHASKHIYSFISSVDQGRTLQIPSGVKSCNFAFDHLLLSLQ